MNDNAHAPGTFCWIELGTSDAAGARAFYTQLFGWGVNEFPMGDMGTYYIFQKNGADSAAMYQIGPQQEGMPPNWLSYVAVASADATTEKARSLGGTVINGPFDVYDMGRMTVLQDPQGAMFAVWETKTHRGVGVRDETNTLCWNELQARDLDAAKKFYAPLFDWRLKESPEYTEMHLGENAVGGMLPSQAPPEVPSYWLPYFAVDDCDASAAQAASLGGMLMVPPMDVPNVGRFAVIQDPQGAVFAIIKLSLTH
ncbi:MAG TPA: VOC family protein [Thermoanaerobaculia bacterium]|nr:VOC family protein [Thermoanaerobaculia bacterium]